MENLRAELVEQERVYFNLRFRRAAGEDIGSSELQKARREIARLKTLITETQRQGAAAAQEKS